MKGIRSPLFYVGDKYKLIPQLKEFFPKDINRFIEPFTGGGSVFLNIDAEKYLLNDIDENVVNIHEFLMEQASDPDEFFEKIYSVIKNYGFSRSYKEDIVPQELKKKHKKTYYSKFNKKAYYELRDDYNDNSKDSPLKLYLLLIYGFNRMLRFNSKGEFNVPVGNVDFNSNVYEALNYYFSYVTNKDINLYNLDYKDFLRKNNFKKKDFIYLDPPYLISSSEYNKIWDQEDEKELLVKLDKLDKMKVRFALSNIIYHKGETNNILKNWISKYNVYPIESNYISYHDNSNKDIGEVLVTNYS
jgi:DNA adenine methylase